MVLTWWEYEELVDTLARYGRSWVHTSRFEWVRYTNSEQTDVALLMQVTPPSGSSRFRTFTCTIVPVEWADAEEYFLELCIRHTTFGDRLETQELLISELGLPENTASAMATALAHVHVVGSLKGPTAKIDFTHPTPQEDGRIATFPVGIGIQGSCCFRGTGTDLFRLYIGMRDISFVGFVKAHFNTPAEAAASLQQAEESSKDNYDDIHAD